MKTLPQIMIAPNGARRTKADHPAVPETIGQTVEVAKQCFAAGAGALHAHVRDKKSEHVLDAGLYGELIAEMAVQVPEMDVQITTEAVGKYTAPEQRALIRDVMPKAVSIGMNEMHSDGDMKAAHALYRFADEAKIAVQHIVYDAEQLAQLLRYIDSGHIPNSPQQMIFVLGRYVKDQQSTPDMLTPFLAELTNVEHQHDWSVCAFGPGETDCLAAAFKAGGKARVGFENSLWNRDGSIAKDNVERVFETKNLTNH